MASKTVSEDSFEADVLKAQGLVLVDFWAGWCGPCKQIAPALEEISSEMAPDLTVAKVNIDDHPALTTTYGVRGIPTMILFKDGQEITRKVGAMPKSKIVEWVAASKV
jgi:thioredoxin 1